ncbi:MAG: hypothetical protein FWH53_08350 [Leptospirales bacterium]|nr:hypothetical protein [Leptospirales bacterium]
MNIIKDMLYKELFPLTQSFGLVFGNVAEVANAVYNEIKRYTKNENGIELKHTILKNVDEVICNNKFTSVPTKVIVFPTITKWTIIWNNSFLCNGWDSLCYNLSNLYKFETFHFCSHDTITTMLPGSYFYYRYFENDILQERYVWACKNDNNKWEFIEKGDECYFETVENYKERIIKNRLNEEKMKELFNKMGINPWDDAVYKINEMYYTISRTKYPETIKEKDITEIYRKRDWRIKNGVLHFFLWY